ncbi:MAG: protein tyrosine phosphatase [Bauldia sp.]|nr:protein tyrosine phosphatase [Bauldia sp.]
MPHVHVCPLSQVPATVAASGASHLISLINDDTVVVRPETIPERNHLFLGINDILEPTEGMVAPAEGHVRDLIAFVGGWDRKRPIVVHCFAGISRSTAAAFITLCALKPERSERDIATRLRSASRFATPNARLVAFADAILARDGRMTAAIQAIGRGETAFESTPFALAVEG